MTDLRIGHGYDVHALAEGLPMILGGIRIKHTKGFIAHSDGDVLAHALTDAILGAAALGDIGFHFPDTSDTYKGADSMKLLRKAVDMAKDKGYCIVNADITVIAQAPKIRPYIEDIRKNIANSIGATVDRVSVKATTEEKLGFTGREEGVSVHAVVLLSK